MSKPLCAAEGANAGETIPRESTCSFEPQERKCQARDTAKHWKWWMPQRHTPSKPLLNY